MKHYLLLDWTGTLANEYNLDKTLCSKIGVEISKKQGIPIKQAKQEYFDFLTKNQYSWIWYDYRLHGKLFGIDWKKAHDLALPKIKLIPRVKSVLSHYRKNGFTIYLLTNAVREVITIRIDYLKMSSFFDLIITSDMVEAPKSSGKHLALALKSIDRISSCYVIGDDLDQDIFPAKRLGLKTIQCKYGKTAYIHSKDGYPRSILCQPDYVIHKFSDLLSIIP